MCGKSWSTAVTTDVTFKRISMNLYISKQHTYLEILKETTRFLALLVAGGADANVPID